MPGQHIGIRHCVTLHIRRFPQEKRNKTKKERHPAKKFLATCIHLHIEHNKEVLHASNDLTLHKLSSVSAQYTRYYISMIRKRVFAIWL